MNYLRTTLLLGLLTGVLLALGNLLGGQTGMLVALGLAIVMNFGSYWFSDKIILKMYQAQEVTPEQAPELYAIVKSLVARSAIPMPKIYIVDSNTPNAFATGRNPNHAVIAATTGILRLLNTEELSGVLAHELAHVQHHDTLISAIAATIAGTISIAANFARWTLLFGGRNNRNQNPLITLLVVIVTPIAAMLIQMAISRSREFGADYGGAKLTGNPLALASALEKLEPGNQSTPMQRANQNPTTAHMFIVNPLVGGLTKLFSTHPPTQERVKRLREMHQGISTS